MNYNKGTIDCRIENIIQEIDRIKWENNGIQPTIIAIIPIKIEKNFNSYYDVTDVRIIYQV